MATRIEYYRALGKNLPPAILAKLAKMPSKDADVLVVEATGQAYADMRQEAPEDHVVLKRHIAELSSQRGVGHQTALELLMMLGVLLNKHI